MNLSLKISDDLENRLGAIAVRTGTSVESCVENALINYIEDLEDYFEAEAVWADIQSGKEQTIPLEEAMKQLGLEH